MTIPGELDPALFLGGYDGSYTPEGLEIVNTSLTNPPELSEAPAPPYLRDLMRDDAELYCAFGLTNDAVGYLVPPFDYELNEVIPYIAEAEGDHYEETNSLGPESWPTINAALTALLAWTPES